MLQKVCYLVGIFGMPRSYVRVLHFNIKTAVPRQKHAISSAALIQAESPFMELLLIPRGSS